MDSLVLDEQEPGSLLTLVTICQLMRYNTARTCQLAVTLLVVKGKTDNFITKIRGSHSGIAECSSRWVKNRQLDAQEDSVTSQKNLISSAGLWEPWNSSRNNSFHFYIRFSPPLVSIAWPASACDTQYDQDWVNPARGPEEQLITRQEEVPIHFYLHCYKVKLSLSPPWRREGEQRCSSTYS